MWLFYYILNWYTVNHKISAIDQSNELLPFIFIVDFNLKRRIGATRRTNMGKVINLICVGGVGTPDVRSDLSRNIRIATFSDLIHVVVITLLCNY